jgi:hypothetical protein
MTDAIHIHDNPGRIAYESWVSEFSARISDEPGWFELSSTAQDAWETIAGNVIDNRVALPTDAVELSIRRFDHAVSFVWRGEADARMSDMVMQAVRRSLAGQGA